MTNFVSRPVAIFLVAISFQVAAANYSITAIGPLTSAYDINAAGQITGAMTVNSVTTAFLYSDGLLQDLGTLPDGENSIGFGVNASGYVTGNARIPIDTIGNTANRALLYSNGVMQNLGTLGGFESQGWDVNDSGQVTGTSWITGNAEKHAFIYSNGTMQSLGTFGGNQSIGFGINNSGQVVGWAHNESGFQRAFLYSNGVMQNIGTLGGFFFRRP